MQAWAALECASPCMIMVEGDTAAEGHKALKLYPVTFPCMRMLAAVLSSAYQVVLLPALQTEWMHVWES